MIRWFWGVIVRPWRHDREFAQRMWSATFDADEQSRISLDAQEHLRALRSNPMADDLLGPIPGTGRHHR